MKKEKNAGLIRVCQLEVTDMPKDARARWLALSDTCRMIINATWQYWFLWHVQNGSEIKMRNHLTADRAWRELPKETRGDRPKWPVQAVPQECAKFIYDEVARRFPEIETTARELCRNSVVQKIGSLRAANGSLPGWLAILFCQQSLPSTTRGNPIPFSKVNAKIIPPDHDDEKASWQMRVKVSRLAPPEGKKVGKAVQEIVKLWSKGRKAATAVSTLKKIVAGEYQFCGSSLVFSKANWKWFAKICYRVPVVETEGLDAERLAVLLPGKARPWILRLNYRNRAPGGIGEWLETARKNIIRRRREINQSARWAGSNRKGHGRRRAQEPGENLSQKWRRIVHNYNHQVTADIVRQCVEAGVGRLRYCQPTGDLRNGRFLFTAGKDEDIREASGWDFSQVETMLRYKCERSGIILEVVKLGEARKARAA